MIDVKNCFTHDGSGGLLQTVTADAVSTQTIDLGAADNQPWGAGKPGYLLLRSIAAFDALTSLEVLLETDEDSGFATNLIQVQKWDFALATLAVGALLINQALPIAKLDRHIRLKFNVVGSDATVGTLLGAITDGPESAVAAVDLVNL